MPHLEERYEFPRCRGLGVSTNDEHPALRLEQLPIDTVVTQQLFLRATLDDAATVEDQIPSMPSVRTTI
jgi:hypothetical protein